MNQTIFSLPQVSLTKDLRFSNIEPRKFRIALYSHDTVGMGHMRRNLLISQALLIPTFKSVF